MSSTAARIMKAIRSAFGRTIEITSSKQTTTTKTPPQPKTTSATTIKISIPQTTTPLKVPESMKTAVFKSKENTNFTSTDFEQSSSVVKMHTEPKKNLESSSNEHQAASEPESRETKVDVSTGEPTTTNEFEQQKLSIGKSHIVTPVVTTDERMKESEESTERKILKTSESQNKTQLQSVRPHIPLIRFRKGGKDSLAMSQLGQSQEQVQPTDAQNLERFGTLAAVVAMDADVPRSNLTNLNSLEWWQTPNKYKRRNIDEKECDIINSGGSDQIYQ